MFQVVRTELQFPTFRNSEFAVLPIDDACINKNSDLYQIVPNILLFHQNIVYEHMEVEKSIMCGIHRTRNKYLRIEDLKGDLNEFFKFNFLEFMKENVSQKFRHVSPKIFISFEIRERFHNVLMAKGM